MKVPELLLVDQRRESSFPVNLPRNPEQSKAIPANRKEEPSGTLGASSKTTPEQE